MKKTTIIRIRISPEEKSKIIEYSKREKMPMSRIIRDELSKRMSIVNN